MEIAVLNIKGESTGRNILLDPSLFQIDYNDHLIYFDLKRYLASQRQGTNQTKERSKLSGSTRKLHRQKGTGSSRKGDIHNPLFRGGARVFGPRPRSFHQKLNKLAKSLVKKSILSQKVKDNAIKVVEDFSFEKPNTKKFLSILRSFKFENQKILFVLKTPDKKLYLSARNLQGKKIRTVNEINSYDLLNSVKLICFESAFCKIQENLKKVI